MELEDGNVATSTAGYGVSLRTEISAGSLAAEADADSLDSPVTDADADDATASDAEVIVSDPEEAGTVVTQSEKACVSEAELV